MQDPNLRRPNKHLQQLLLPFSYEDCMAHRNTTKMGRPLEDSKLCKCCGFPYEKEFMQSGFALQDIFYLGQTLPLYFMFIKITIWLSVFISVLFSFLTIFYNVSGNSCAKSEGCQSEQFLVQLSFCHKLYDRPALNIQFYLADAVGLAVFVLLVYVHKKIEEIQLEIGQTKGQKDYAVVLTLPDMIWERKDIAGAINQWWEKESKNANQDIKKIIINEVFPIQSILVFYQLECLKNFQQELEILQGKLKKKSSQQDQKWNKLRVNQIKMKIRNKHLLRTNRCLVLFKYPIQSKYVLDSHESFWHCNRIKFLNQSVKVAPASNPQEINWQNQQNLRNCFVRIMTTVFCIVLAIAFQAAIYGVLWIQFSSSQNYLAFIIVPIQVTSIVCCYALLRKIACKERRSDKFQERSSEFHRLCVAMFVTTSIFPIISITLLNSSDICKTNGLVNQFSETLLEFTAISTVLPFLNPSYFVSWLNRNKLKNYSFNTIISQKQANQMCELSEINLSWRYAALINWSWCTCLFLSYIPIAPICLFIAAFFFLLSQKRAFTDFNRQSKSYGNQLNAKAFNMLMLCPILLLIGNVSARLMTFVIRQDSIQWQDFIPDFVVLLTCLILTIIPIKKYRKISIKLFSSKKVQVSNEIEYAEAQPYFSTTFLQQNPAYQKFGRIKNGMALYAQQNVLSRTLSKVLKSSNLFQHPIKVYNPPKQDEYSYSEPDIYTPRIQRRQTVPKIVPKLPIRKTEKYLNGQTPIQEEIEMVNFRKLCDDMDTNRRERVADRIKTKVSKLSK